ncbi:MAG: NAD(P)/FAD-dependent oxidoreductase [Myxococcales bacterium]|nr:NAD(P)/FAD-dependent oxidoreductase [Myxococcales bacterium]
MSKPDFLVVGSGLAGLAFAALAARAGRRVLVLEAHEKAGGYGHTFTVGAHQFNAQLHYVWNVGEGRTVHRFLSRLGLVDAVPFVRLDVDGYDHMRIPGFSLDIPSDFDELARRLAALFPSHAGALRAFVAEVRATDEELEAIPSSLRELSLIAHGHGYRRLFRYRNATLGAVFDRFALPLEARALLALQWPDFMLPPSRLSFFAWVKLFAGYARGAYYPVKHFEHVIDEVVRVLRESGGALLLQRKVTRFLLDGDRVSGVEVEHVDDKGVGTGEFERMEANAVVCNMDPRAAACMIGLDRFSRAVRAKLDYEYSASSFVAYLSVKDLDLRAHGFGAFNVFHGSNADLDGAFAAMHDRGDYRAPSFAMSTPTLVSSAEGAAPEGRQILELLTVANHQRFLEKKLDDPHAYRESKSAVLSALLDVVEREYVPNIRDHLAQRTLGSPTTSERYARAPQGNSYGSAMTPAQMWPRRLDHDTSIRDFYFCNASAGFAGFAGTIWTACRLYARLTGDELLSRAR